MPTFLGGRFVDIVESTPHFMLHFVCLSLDHCSRVATSAGRGRTAICTVARLCINRMASGGQKTSVMITVSGLCDYVRVGACTQIRASLGIHYAITRPQLADALPQYFWVNRFDLYRTNTLGHNTLTFDRYLHNCWRDSVFYLQSVLVLPPIPPLILCAV